MSIMVGLLAACSTIMFGNSAYTFFIVQKQFLEVTPGALGNISGQLIDGPFGVTVLFCWLTWELWSMATLMRNPAPPNADAPKVTITRKMTIWFLKMIAYALGFFAALGIIHGILGALVILCAEDPSYDHNPFTFDFSHELYFWLPTACAITGTILALIAWKIKSRVERK